MAAVNGLPDCTSDGIVLFFNNLQAHEPYGIGHNNSSDTKYFKTRES